MTSNPRYLFILPDMDRPVGGINVALQFIEELRRAGIDAAPLYASASYHYPFFQLESPTYFWPGLERQSDVFMGRKEKLKKSLQRVVKPFPKGQAINQKLDLRPSDVFVVPEFGYPEYCDMFPDNPRVLLVQDVFGVSRAFLRDARRNMPWISQFESVVTTSKATQSAADYLTNGTSHHIPLNVTRGSFRPDVQKKRQIVYMPRKRSEEVDIVVAALRRRLEAKGWHFHSIHNKTYEQTARLLEESLIFLSFSHQEGFGLPPAEAMAAGCIVVGYTGVGGEEFFKPEFGVPVQDSDVIGFADAVEAIAVEYDHDPTRLDEMRAQASHHIKSSYGHDQMKTALLDTWEKIGRTLS